MKQMWDQRYGEEGFAYGEVPNDHLRTSAEGIPPGPVLCLAAGEGRNAVFLAERGYEVTAVDQSGVGLAKARALAAARGVSLTTEQADLGTYEIAPGAWAGIVMIFCHLPPGIRARVHRMAAAGLRPGGVAVIEAYTPEQLRHRTGGPPAEAMLYTLGMLRDELPGLELEIGREVEREIIEGRYHKGQSAVVQVVARRPLEG